MSEVLLSVGSISPFQFQPVLVFIATPAHNLLREGNAPVVLLTARFEGF